MRITKAVKLHLRADAGVAAIVGSKVHLRRAPQRSEYPHVIISIAGAEWPTRSQARRSEDVSHIIKTRVQIDCFSLDENQVDELAEAVAGSLDDFMGTTQGVVITRSLQDDERDNYSQLEDASDEGVHRITQMYAIWYDEPTV
jgi:Protein of unknown function (DUF3168)